MSSQAKCASARWVHQELAQHYLLWCASVAKPADCERCDLRPHCVGTMLIHAASERVNPFGEIETTSFDEDQGHNRRSG